MIGVILLIALINNTSHASCLLTQAIKATAIRLTKLMVTALAYMVR